MRTLARPLTVVDAPSTTTSTGQPASAGPDRDQDRYVPMKAIFDVVIALVLLVLLAPLIAFLILLVKLSSRGPTIYRQVRLGRDGSRFMIYRLRTMTNHCERDTGPRWSIPGDSRVTRLGRLLRQTHLDELPQLWNVLRREMSLVGPRPERPEFVSQLERALPKYRERLSVLPGITGLAQVQLPPDTELADVRVKLAHDLCYVEWVGPWLDARILAATALRLAGVSFDLTSRLFALPSPDSGDGHVFGHESSAVSAYGPEAF
jgi:lipopolysaccharide/colanic/teichoic acid biosynthesis glycosyltransferase